MLYCTSESYAKFSRLTLHNNQSQEFAYQKRKRYVEKFLGFCQFQYRIYINVIATICLKSRTIVKVWHVRSHPTFKKKGKHLYTHTFKLKKEELMQLHSQILSGISYQILLLYQKQHFMNGIPIILGRKKTCKNVLRLF